MKTMAVILAIAAILFLLDRLLLWLEARGHIYWRKTKRRPSGDFIEIMAPLDPGIRHVIEARQKAREERGREAEDKNGGAVGDGAPRADE